MKAKRFIRLAVMALGASPWRRGLAVGVLVAALAAPATQAPGGYITVYGGATYDSSSQTGYTGGSDSGVNDAGTAVGYATKYDAGVSKGTRAVRWDASGTAAAELGNLGTDATGYTRAYANAVNDAGTAVGYAEKYDAGSSIGNRAVYWGLDGAAVDLNTLIDPASGWTLTEASAISDTDWIVGIGSYDPDGAGGLDAYDRLFLMQVPEPATLSLLAAGLGAVWMGKRRRTKGPFDCGLRNADCGLEKAGDPRDRVRLRD